MSAMQTAKIAARISLLLLCAPLLQAQEPVLPKPAIPSAPTAPAPKGDLKPPAVKKRDEPPPPLQALAQTVTTARQEELPRVTFNALAQTMSIPEQPEGQGAVYSVPQNSDGVHRSIIVRRMTDPARVDIIVFVIRGETMHLFHTGPDGLLQTAVQRSRNGTNTTVSGREVDADFRAQIQVWQTWRENYLREKNKPEPKK